MSPIVSIIMPTFDRLEYLPPAVESVRAQSFTDWELLIADDGSSLETRNYLQSLSDPRIRVLWLAHTGRPAAVSNVAVREARGRYIAFLDSDDLWLPEKLQRQLESLQRHPERKWSCTRFSLVDGAGQPMARASDKPTPSGWILEKLLRGETVIAQPSVLVARELLEPPGAFDEDLVMCYDDELWFKLATKSEIDGIDTPLTLVRRHKKHSGSDIIAWRDRRRVFEKALRSGSLGRPVEALLLRLRAEMAAGLARSYAVSGQRLRVIGTLCSSVRYSWRYSRWWHDSTVAVARAFTPPTVRSLVRRYRRVA